MANKPGGCKRGTGAQPRPALSPAHLKQMRSMLQTSSARAVGSTMRKKVPPLLAGCASPPSAAAAATHAAAAAAGGGSARCLLLPLLLVLPTRCCDRGSNVFSMPRGAAARPE